MYISVNAFVLSMLSCVYRFLLVFQDFQCVTDRQYLQGGSCGMAVVAVAMLDGSGGLFMNATKTGSDGSRFFLRVGAGRLISHLTSGEGSRDPTNGRIAALCAPSVVRSIGIA